MMRGREWKDKGGDLQPRKRRSATLQIQICNLADRPNDVIVLVMITLLDQGIQAVRELPADRQDLAGQLLLTLAATTPRYQLTDDQVEELKLTVEQADRGEFASDAEAANAWRRFDPRGCNTRSPGA